MNKNDFKCGQWLTSSHEITGLKAIKFKSWDPNYPNCPLLIEAIADGVLDVNHNTGGIWNSDYGLGLKPIALSEIQQYLPDGHPDKIINTIEEWSVGSYVVGRWYKVVEHNFYAKCFDFKSNRMIASQYLVISYNADKNGYKFCPGYKWIEATQEELATFLPKGHPDLIVKSIEEWSVGSYVVFLKEYGGHPKGTISKIIINEPQCAQVEHSFYGRNEGCRLYKDKECKWFATIEEAEAFAATLKEPVKPLPEYVECINDVSSGGELNKGQIYQVEQIDNWQYKLKGLRSKRDIGRFKPSTKSAYIKQCLQKNTVIMDKRKLSVFPREGSCETIDERLIKYLNSRNDTNNVKLGELNPNTKGIAWNSSSSWYYYTSTNKQKYALADLEHLFDTTESKRWSAGTYGVLMSDYSGIVNDFKKGFIDVIETKDFRNNEQYIIFKHFGSYKPENLEYTKGVEIKWFETKEAAETFVKLYMPSVNSLIDSSASMKSTNPCCEIALSDSSDASYKLDIQGTDERLIYPVFIKDDKPKKIKEEPIKLSLTSIKNFKINLVV